MNWDGFKQKIEDNNLEDLENELIKKIESEQNEDVKNLLKYQLGICYTYNMKTQENAISIFKELISNDFNRPYIYSYLAQHTRNLKKKEEYV